MNALQAPLDIPIPDPPSPEDEVRTPNSRQTLSLPRAKVGRGWLACLASKLAAGFGSVTVTQVVVLCQKTWTRLRTHYLIERLERRDFGL